MTARRSASLLLLVALAAPAAAKGPPRETREETLQQPLAWWGVQLPPGTRVVWSREKRPGAAWQLDDVSALGAELVVGDAVFAAGTRIQAWRSWTYRGTLARDLTVDGWPLAGRTEAEISRVAQKLTVEKGVLARDLEIGPTRLIPSDAVDRARLGAGTAFELRGGKLAEADCPNECTFGALSATGRMRMAPNGDFSLFLARDAEVAGTGCRAAPKDEARFTGSGKVARCAGASATVGGIAFTDLQLEDDGRFHSGNLRTATTVHGLTLPAGTGVEGWPLASAEFSLPDGESLLVGGLSCANAIRFHRRGQLAQCWFSAEQRVHGLWLRKAELDPGGKLVGATLARAQVVRGVGFPAGSRIDLDAAGRLQSAVPASVTRVVVRGKQCGRYATAPTDDDDTSIRFRPDGSVRSCARGDDDGFEYDRGSEPDQYTIYDAVLRDYPAVTAIAEQTVRSACAPNGLAGVDADTLASFRTNDAAPFVLTYNMRDERKYKLVRDGAELAFSAVGMNARRDQALVYVEHRGKTARHLLLSRKPDDVRWDIRASASCASR